MLSRLIAFATTLTSLTTGPRILVILSLCFLQSSIVVAAAGIGLLAVIAAYVWRARSAPVAWLDDT